jgi:hypothetical protein
MHAGTQFSSCYLSLARDYRRKIATVPRVVQRRSKIAFLRGTNGLVLQLHMQEVHVEDSRLKHSRLLAHNIAVYLVRGRALV